MTRLLFAAVANVCSDVGEGVSIEKVKLTIVNFKMDGRGSAEKDASENDPTGGKGDNRDEATCNSVLSVCSCSNTDRAIVALAGDGDLGARARLRLRIQWGGIFSKIHYGRAG
ncbi:hypothetical protein GCM10023156_59410 [Novipirellula rosea]|uniref:Uncharacterized protein n=1 Tax=Novipirellula rosea TaxID=1031540 RepID=A0ABP8NNM0_9BACT